MRISDVNAYFEEIARKHKDIQHSDDNKRFYKIDELDVLSGSLKGTGPFLFIENYEGKISGPNRDSISNGKIISFTILDSVSDTYDTSKKASVYESTEKIGENIISRMINDSLTLHHLMRGFDPTETNYYKVGPIFDNKYGMTYEIKVKVPDNSSFAYNQNDWIE